MIMFRQDNDVYTDEAGSTVSVTTTSGAAQFQRYSSTSLRGSSGVYEDVVNYDKLNHDRSPQQELVPPHEVIDVSDNSNVNGMPPTPRIIAVESYVQSDPDLVVTAKNCCFSRMTYIYIGMHQTD